ncbi:MAG TPA: glycosyltransferase family 4 protein, partial [Tepidisphaeraceae bacterium]|nr:glycosyltransferase family 4 protein [Tepidisphaeraceae bacterium]
LARLGHHVTLIGAGQPIAGRPYRFIHAGCIGREWFTHFPSLPYVRTQYAYEELTFAPSLWSKFRPQDYEVTVTCGFPFTNRGLTGRNCPPHVFATQNGDHMLNAPQIDYRRFRCDGLICTNPEIFQKHSQRWKSALIPNGVDLEAFHPGRGDRRDFGLPENRPIALMVSALTPSKRVMEGISAASKTPDLTLVIAGDGELRGKVRALGDSLMPGRFFWLYLSRQQMPNLYRCADVVLHMSLSEPFGNVYLEALATGLPMVAQETAATRWILEDTGLLVDAADESKVIVAIQDALKTGPDARRRALAERRFGWPMIASQYEGFLSEVARRL